MIDCIPSPAQPDTRHEKSPYLKQLQDRTVQKIRTLSDCLEGREDHGRTVLVLDMDGTVYPHDGPQNGFRGSTKERLLIQHHTAFIRTREPDADESEVVAIFEESLAHPVGSSVFLSERYGCSRDEVLTSIWSNLSPEDCIGKPDIPVSRVLAEIRARVSAMLLVTSAPALWKNKVFDFLDIDSPLFDSIMTTEDFPSKAFVFREIAKIRPAIRVISVGDTHSSDILPAQQLGYLTLHINGRNSLSDVHRLLDASHE